MLEINRNVGGTLKIFAVCDQCGLELTNPSAGTVAFKTKGKPSPKILHKDCKKFFKQVRSSGDWKTIPARKFFEQLGH